MNFSALERSEQLARRKEIYEVKFPDSRAGQSRALGMNKALGRDVGETISPTFAADTAAKTGLSERTIQHEVQIANNIIEPLKNVIQRTPLADNQSELLKIARTDFKIFFILKYSNARNLECSHSTGQLKRDKLKMTIVCWQERKLKMKITTFLGVFGCWLLLTASACAQDFSRFDLSTDEGVNAAREAILKAKGAHLDDQSRGCLKRKRDLPKIVIVGGFAYDVGCLFRGVFAGSKYFDADDPALSKNVLTSLGWTGAIGAEREKLALRWTEKGLLAFNNVIEVANNDFKKEAFQAPQAVTTASGEIVITLWVSEPPGMLPETNYVLLEERFSTDGNSLKKSVLKQFTVSIKQQ